MKCVIVLILLWFFSLSLLVGFSIYKLFFKNTKYVSHKQKVMDLSHVNKQKGMDLSNNQKIIDLSNKQKRIDLSHKYYGKELKKCNTYTTSDSHGILFDESIVCNVLKFVKATPYFYFELFDNYATINDWIFVNLDATNFNKLKDINSPSNILCKNRQTFDILFNTFSSEKNILYTGFTSMDKFNPEIKKNYRKIIHIVGKSPHKGTLHVIDAWLKHKEWPLLTIICNNIYLVLDNINKILKGKEYDNIKLITSFIS